MTQLRRKDCYRLIGIIGLGLTLLAGSVQASTIKCWRTKQGIRECAHVVPPEYAQTRIEVLNEQGLVIQVLDAAKTDAELAVHNQEIERIKAEERAKAEKRERDRVLLSAYTTERDLNIARDQQLNAAQAVIDLGLGRRNSLQSHLDMMTKRAGDFERGGKAVPETLLTEMQEIRVQIKDNETYITEKEAEKKKLADKFAADIKRFRELKGITTTTK